MDAVLIRVCVCVCVCVPRKFAKCIFAVAWWFGTCQYVRIRLHVRTCVAYLTGVSTLIYLTLLIHS
jgi:hypothetical protein